MEGNSGQGTLHEILVTVRAEKFWNGDPSLNNVAYVERPQDGQLFKQRSQVLIILEVLEVELFFYFMFCS